MICLICTDIVVVANHHGVDAMVPPRLWGRADQLRPRCGRAATAPPRTSAPRRDQQLSQDLKIPTKDPQPHVPTVAAEVLISTPIQTIARLQRANCRLDPRVTPPCLAEFHSGLLLLTLSLNVAWLGQARLLYQFHQLGVIAPVPGIMRLFWAFSPSTPPESPSQEDSSLANMLDTLEARCRSDGPPAGPRSIDPLPGSRSFLTVSAVA